MTVENFTRLVEQASQNVRIMDRDRTTVLFEVTAGASTDVTDRIAGRTVVASDGVFTDDGTDLTALVGGGGGVSDPLTVGPVTIGSSAGGSGGYSDVLSSQSTGSYGEATISSYADTSNVNSGLARVQLSTNNAEIHGLASDAGDTFFMIKGNSGQISPELVIKAPGTNTATVQLSGLAAPAAPSTGGVVFTRDNGSGKQQLVCRFPSGAVQVLATEP